jgi:putative hydrolase of the HAD superfamily
MPTEIKAVPGRAPTARIRVVFFDFGGVLASEGFREGLFAIARSQGLAPEEFFQIAREAVYESGYVTGTGAESGFWDLVRLRTGVRGSRAELSAACVDRFRLRPGMLELVRSLRALGVMTAILSDQTDWLERLDARAPFFREFDRVFNSFRLGKGKRDPSLFDDAVREFSVAPAAAVFIDDDPGNVSRTAERGLHALLFRGEAPLRRDLGELLGAGLERVKPSLRAPDH